MAKKKARPEMYWDERKELWRKRLKIDGHWSEVSGKTQEAVREKAKAIERQQRAGLLINDQTLFGEYAQEWYKVKAAGIKPKTKEMYKIVLNNHIFPVLGNMRIRDIKPLHIQRLMAEKTAMSQSAHHKILITLNQIFKSAIDNNIMEKNPARDIGESGVAAQPKKPLSPEQQKALLEAVKGTRAEIFVMLCLLAGLRREEALGMLWSSVHYDPVPYIDVSHTITFDGNKAVHSDELKTPAARRKIPVPDVLAAKLIETQKNANSVLVVPSAKGQPMTLSAFRKMWDKVPPLVSFYVTPHLLRHTYVTNLCARGIDVKKIQYLAGHEDVKLTLSVYAHVVDNSPERLATALYCRENGRNKTSPVENPVGNLDR